MTVALQQKIGQVLDTYSFTVERGKIREFALAIGDTNPAYINGDKVPPTFPTVIDFWGGGKSTSELLGLNMKKVLHGGQQYDYIQPIRVGETITIQAVLEEVYTKAAMNFVVLRKDYTNEAGELVLIARSTVIERH